MKQTESSNTLDLYWQLLRLLLSRASGLPDRFNVLFLSLCRQVTVVFWSGHGILSCQTLLFNIDHPAFDAVQAYAIGIIFKWVRV